jgi:hypothetical protein
MSQIEHTIPYRMSTRKRRLVRARQQIRDGIEKCIGVEWLQITTYTVACQLAGLHALKRASIFVDGKHARKVTQRWLARASDFWGLAASFGGLAS